MITVLEVLSKTAGFLEGRGVESGRLNAELIVGHALGLKRMQLYLQFERVLSEAELASIRELVRRRGQREPLQHVLGEVEFHGLRLKADRRALIPRPETERLVEILIERLGSAPPARVLDLGTGSGAIALALAAAWPGAAVTATDLSAQALEQAGENAQAAGLSGRVSFVLSDWFAALGPGERFDLVVSNPPYLSAAETAAAQPEVRDHEPASALTSGEEGVASLRVILGEAHRRLAPGGLLALETGPTQHPGLLALAASGGYSRTESLRDLAGRDRFVLAWPG
jgi:release factor glutamine methyltransferase